MLENIKELGTVRSPDEGTLPCINNFIAAETCIAVHITVLVGDKNSPFPHPLSDMCFHRLHMHVAD